MNTNRTIVDLNKVQYADFFWSTSTMTSPTKPKQPTVNGVIVGDEPAAWLDEFPNETMLQRATRRGLLDKWEPVVRLQLTANHSLTYTGAKAQSIWREWNKRQFSKKGKDNNGQ